jgi:hypothetical protein
MKKLLLLLSLGLYVVSNAQNVGIGTSLPNSNAMLDVSATNKGLLIPRVNLVALTSNNLNSFGLSALPVTSLLVFNTTASSLPSTYPF